MQCTNGCADSIAKIALDFPDRPTSGQLLEFLLQAERVGYERGLRAMAERAPVMERAKQPDLEELARIPWGKS